MGFTGVKFNATYRGPIAPFITGWSTRYLYYLSHFLEEPGTWYSFPLVVGGVHLKCS